MSATDNLGRNSTGITYYPGSSAGFFAAGTFYLVWSLGVYTKGIINMLPGVRKIYEKKICRGRNIPIEGIYLTILGYCAFFGQLGQAGWKFYDSEDQSYTNQNNLTNAAYFLGIGLAGTAMILGVKYNLNQYFENTAMIVPNVMWIIAMAFKSMQSMTSLDYIILVLSILTYGAFVAALLAETFMNGVYTKLARASGLMYIAVWYFQTYTIYFRLDNSWQNRSFAVDYVVNIFFIEMFIISWIFGLLWFVLTKNYDSTVAQVAENKDNKKRLPIEEEISKSESQNVDIELLNKPLA